MAAVPDRPTPSWVHALPEAELRGTRDKYRLDKLIASRRNRRRYLELVRDASNLLTKNFGYEPGPLQLRSLIARVLLEGRDLLDLIAKEGGSGVLDDKDQLVKIATAAAGAIVAMHLAKDSSERP